MSRVVALLLSALALTSTARAQQAAGKKRRPLPPEFGRVVMDNHSSQAKLPPVVFDHWLHRAKFTCRLCHVDVGFAMKPGGTDVKAADNMAGYYCGACHNGKLAVDGRKVFESCSPATVEHHLSGHLGHPSGIDAHPTCLRCHSQGKDVKPQVDFASFTRNLPKGRFGNGVDWEKAEETGLVKPADFLEGISIKRKSISAQKDFALGAKLQGMPDIIFSHQKHTVWNGCELCHPEIFVGVKKGATKYSMVEIFEGKYCGVCHVNVAFPLIDCQRCHTKPVQ
jgi:c(7)-type cytochrome triheme protein